MSVEIIKKATPPVEITGALTDTELRAADVPVTLDSEMVAVSGPLTDTELRATAVPVSGPLTDTELRAADVPVTLDSEVVAVSGPLTDTELRATAVPVSGPLTDTELRATPVPVAPALPAALFYGVVAVAAAGTAEPLAAASTPLNCGLVCIKATSGNSGLIYVGDSDVDSTNGYPLAAGEEMRLTIADLADVYVDAAQSADSVKFVAS